MKAFAGDGWGRRVAVGGGMLAFLIAILVLLPGWLRPSVDRDRVRTGKVERGPVEEVVEATGAVVPAFEGCCRARSRRGWRRSSSARARGYAPASRSSCSTPRARAWSWNASKTASPRRRTRSGSSRSASTRASPRPAPPQGAADREGEGAVFVVQGDEAVRRTVRFGLSGSDHDEVLGGLEPGEEVILSDMRDSLHLQRVKLD